MKVFLRHKSTGLYYSGWGNWSERSDAAFAFESVELATERAAAEGLDAIELVVKPDGDAPEYVVALPRRHPF